MKIYKILLIAGCIIWLSGCAPEVTKKPAEVTSHNKVDRSLDNCDKLGQVKTEYKVDKDISRRENEMLARAAMRQQAYDDYRANNIVFINTRYVEGGFRVPDMIYSRGIAYRCD